MSADRPSAAPGRPRRIGLVFAIASLQAVLFLLLFFLIYLAGGIGGLDGNVADQPPMDRT